MGRTFWATPGGALEPGETFEQAAIRELREETGIGLDQPGPQAFRREVVFQMPDGEPVRADERYFVIKVPDLTVSCRDWTACERDVMKEFRWWSVAELEATEAAVFPDGLPAMLRAVSESSCRMPAAAEEKPEGSALLNGHFQAKPDKDRPDSNRSR